MRHLISLSLVSLLGFIGTISAEAATLKVPEQYHTIGAAVAAAQAGDKIHVEEGVYSNEVDPDQVLHTGIAVFVNKPNLEIVGEDGAVLDGSILTPTVGFSTGFYVSTTGVTIRGFTIKGYSYGISQVAGGCRFQANTVTNCGVGILSTTGTDVNSDLPAPARTTIDHNTTSGNGTGISLQQSENVIVTHNVVNNNGTDTTNSINMFAGPGIEITDESINCKVDHNNVYANTQHGVSIAISSYITVSDNTSIGNALSGFDLDADNLCSLSNNTADLNGTGIDLHDETSMCSVSNNEVSGNAQNGILIEMLSFPGFPDPFPCTLNVMTNNNGRLNGSGNPAFLDARDQCAPNNTWSHNKFARTSGI